MIDFDSFYEWAVSRFGDENVRIKHTAHGDEICTHSLWSEDLIGKVDYKYHLWMNPSGGKSKNPENGSYRCWLTDKSGSLVALVSEVDGVPWEEAADQIGGVVSLRVLERQVHEFFAEMDAYGNASEVEETIVPVNEMPFPDGTYEIDLMFNNSYWKKSATQYFLGRHIPTKGLYVCTEGDYKNRVIIPYYDSTGTRVFWNARALKDSNPKRYMKPPNSDAAKHLYMTSWPSTGSDLYIMEGEFDAMTLGLMGLNACAIGGKALSDIQLEMLQGYNVILAFDADDAGLKATIAIGNTLLENGFPNLRYVRPPKSHKDWNKFRVSYNPETVLDYIKKYVRPYTTVTASRMLALSL